VGMMKKKQIQTCKGRISRFFLKDEMWWVINKMNLRRLHGVHTSAPTSNYFRYTPRSAIGGSFGNSMFNFFKKLPDCFPVSTPYYIPIRNVQGFILYYTILAGIEYCLTVVLICISLMTGGVEHHFMCLLAICISSLEKCLFTSFAYF